MTLFEVSTYALGVTAIAGVVDLFKKIFGAGDDGPIRVKGGSFFVQTDDDDWKEDTDGMTSEFVYKSRPKEWEVTLWEDEKKKKVIVGPRQANDVLVRINQAGKIANVKFTAKGHVRVVADKNSLKLNKKQLEDLSSGTFIAAIQFIPNKGDDQEFNSTQKPYMELKPVP